MAQTTGQHDDAHTPRASGDSLTPVHQRVAEVLGEDSNRQVAEHIGMNTETVRRQRIEQRPQVQFLTGLIEHYGVNLNWLLTGEGEKFLSDQQRDILSRIPRDELLREIGRRAEATEQQLKNLRFDIEDLKQRFLPG